MTRFGDFRPLCTDTPSYTWCNLFYRQLKDNNSALLQSPSIPSISAPVGVNPVCGIERAGQNGSLGNIANVIACGLSIFLAMGLVFLVSKRKAAVGRVEFRYFLILYLLTLPFQLLTNGGLLEQGSTALVALTSIHAGLVAALFWALLANGLVATQVVEDGTFSSLLPFGIFTVLFFAVTTYISFDVALVITDTIGRPDGDPRDLHSIPLFVLTSIWPGAAALLYFLLMTYIVLVVLREVKPMVYYAISAVLFVLSQLAWFLLGRVVCRGSNRKVDGSFIATVLETAAVSMLYLAWRSITEENWDEEYY
ncbi:chitin synthase export chaperone [Moniliophthora roreri MCA 2997]|uniref:Chitin synthase export chaperone n=2 Tax=Moniliophthora roreri TaxID=221103 RepID=V2X3H2_MONRO|nr:chitin synthase export chaperone [Moniliophthora roreri MCA 2997]KAI3599082.1 chitin synthase export chaperone [Moniliophthora roreri]